MKEKTSKERKNEQERGKKRYLERIIETDEANKLIKDFVNTPEKDDNEDDKQVLRSFI